MRSGRRLPGTVEGSWAWLNDRQVDRRPKNYWPADAKAYFDSALIGDPVEITGSPSKFPTTSDVFDWLLPWDQWKSMSALS